MQAELGSASTELDPQGAGTASIAITKRNVSSQRYALEQPPLDIQKGMHVWDRLCLSTVAHLRGLEWVADPSGGAEAWLWFDRRFS